MPVQQIQTLDVLPPYTLMENYIFKDKIGNHDIFFIDFLLTIQGFLNGMVSRISFSFYSHSQKKIVYNYVLNTNVNFAICI